MKTKRDANFAVFGIYLWKTQTVSKRKSNKRIPLQTNMETQPNTPPMSPRHTHRILQYRLRHTFRHITRSSDYFSITVTKLGDICSWVFLLQLSMCVWSSDPIGSDMTWHFLLNGGCLISRSCRLDSLVNCSSIICPRRKGPEEVLGKLALHTEDGDILTWTLLMLQLY